MTRQDRSYPPDLARHSVSAGAVVLSPDKRILAIKRRDNGAWVQPGGVVELDETPQQAVTREILEETGVQAEAEKLTGVYKNMQLGVISLVFRCRQTGGAPQPTGRGRRGRLAYRRRRSAAHDRGVRRPDSRRPGRRVATCEIARRCVASTRWLDLWPWLS